MRHPSLEQLEQRLLGVQLARARLAGARFLVRCRAISSGQWAAARAPTHM